MNHAVSLDFFKENYLPNNYNENMFNKDGTINPNYNSFKKTGLISQILEDHFDNLYLENKEMIDMYRPNAPKEIKKVIDCHNKNLGCFAYTCPECNEFVFISKTCKSRLCSSCGYKYKLERVENILDTAYGCKHRQIVFTIPKEFRKFFFFPFEKRIDLLFQAVNLTLTSMANDSFKKNSTTKKKKKKYKSKTLWTPGFFSFLHTFGRDLKWNPHIHVLIAEIKLGNNGECKKWEYFNYDALSKRFQKILLDLMLKNIPKTEFSIINVNNSYKNHPKGFYVYAEPKKFKSLKDGIEYVCRYCGRCPISENRVINYDGTNVTFSYTAHEDDTYHEVSTTAQNFIFMLLRHVIPEQFKIIRYYGFYRKKHSLHATMKKLISEEKIPARKHFLKFSNAIELFFKRNPYKCPKCNTLMHFVVCIT